MEEIRFVTSMRFSEVLDINPELILLLSRWEIQLGFGEKTVEEVCTEQGLSPFFFLLVCKVYTIRGYLPDDNAVAQVSLDDLLRFLSTSHHYYLEERIPHIGRHLERIVAQCDARYGQLLQRFYEEYRKEVVAHFDYEENTVFPYIRRLECGEDGGSFRIREYRTNHSNIEDKLQDLINILIKYLPAELSPKERISITMDIYHLTEDINKHAILENNLLVSYAKMKERKAHGKTK